MKKKNHLFILIILFFVQSRSVKADILIPLYTNAETLATIQLKNPTNQERVNEIIAIDFSLLSSRLNNIKEFRVINAETSDEVIYQLEYLGMDKPQNLLLQVTLPSDGEIKLHVQKGKPIAFIPKTFARYIPERKDDFAWENNKVAFRMYGKALESTNENAYGIDVWSKRTDKMIINKWYKKGDYHADHGEGLDYYSVGFSLGAGDIAPFMNDSIYFSKNYYKHKVLDNGPLRSTFTLMYKGWKVEGATITATKTISLDADSYLNRISVNYEIDKKMSIPAVIGIVKRRNPGDIWLSEKNKIMAYWEPEYKNKGITGIGCILTGDLEEMQTTNEHLLSLITVNKNESVVYYAGAAWNKAGKITSAEEWFSYLSAFSYQLKNPVKVTVF